MDLIDIKKSINSILKDNFPDAKLNANEVEEGFSKPAFFTQLIPISLNYETVNFVSVKLMIVINYYTPLSIELDNLKIAMNLRKAFGMTLKVNDRYLLLENITTDNSDSILQFKFDLNYYQDVEKIYADGNGNIYELMKELNIEKRG